MSAHGVLWHHAQFTTVAALLGFSLAVVFAVAMATLMVWSRTFENAVYPLLVGTQVIPKVAIAPLLVVYLGFNLAPKVFLAFLSLVLSDGGQHHARDEVSEPRAVGAPGYAPC